MRHLTIQAIFLFLALALQAQTFQSLSVYNREFQPIHDATVTVNGIQAIYKYGYEYQYPADLKPPFTVILQHPSFLTTKTESHAQMEGMYYLRRAGEDYYYYAGNTTRPCLRHPQWLIVAARLYDQSGRTLDIKTTRSKMHAIIAKYGYAIVCEQKLTGMDSQELIRENIYVLRRNSTSTSTSTTKAIQQFSSEPSVEFAGPAIISTSPNEAISLYPQVDLLFAVGTDTAAIRKDLNTHGYKLERPQPVANYLALTVNIGKGDLQHYNQATTYLWTLPGIIQASPRSFTFKR